jgi:hypothetical protein
MPMMAARIRTPLLADGASAAAIMAPPPSDEITLDLVPVLSRSTPG